MFKFSRLSQRQIEAHSDEQIARRYVIAELGHVDSTSRLVCIVDGDVTPHYEGDGWHFKTRGGTYIIHPSAYAKKGYSNMVYSYSDLHIVAGREWVARYRATLIK